MVWKSAVNQILPHPSRVLLAISGLIVPEPTSPLMPFYRDLTSLPARNDSRGLLFACPRVICFGVLNFAAFLFGVSLFDVVVFVDKPDQLPVSLFYSWRFLGFVCIGNRSS